MFFFFSEDNDIDLHLKEKINAFVESLQSNGYILIENSNKVDIIYKEYCLCTLKGQLLGSQELKINLLKSNNSEYNSLKTKEIFQRFWRENIIEKEFLVTTNNNGALKSLLNIILNLSDIFINDVTVDFKIHEIGFKDYRRFKDEVFSINSKLTVLIGKNGSGKTSLLEGIAVGIGAFLNGIDDITDSKNIYKEDVRFTLEDTVEMPVRTDYPPTVVKFKSRFINQDIGWSRTKSSLNGSTSTKDSSIVTNTVRQLVNDIRNQNEDVPREIILPIFSYHGVGRVASFTKDMKILEKTEKLSRFVGYKDCLKPASNYKFFVNWYRKMKFREFEYSRKIPVLSAVNNSIKRALIYLTENEYNKVLDIVYNEGDITVRFENGQLIPVSHLSDGYKNIIGIISDISYRMAILNPHLGENILYKTPGIVLIDEIEVHLHPLWQQNILRILKEIFPKVQFIVTTHSPMVVSTTMENEAIELYSEDNKIKYSKVGNPQEWYMRDILRNVFGVEEKVNKHNEDPINTLEDKLKKFSDLVKAYATTKDDKTKEEINLLYEEIKPSLPEGSPRRNVIERLKGLIS